MRKAIKIISYIVAGLILSAAGLAVFILYVKANTFNLMPPAGPFVHTTSWDIGYVSAEGTWVLEGDKSGTPIQFTKIKCRRSKNTCLVAQADTFKMSSVHLLDVGADNVPISKWDETTIIYKTEADCVSYVYTINRTSKRVNGRRLRKPASEVNAADCSAIVADELLMTLSNGQDVYFELKDDVQREAIQYFWAVLALIWGGVLWKIAVLFRSPPAKAEISPDHTQSV